MTAATLVVSGPAIHIEIEGHPSLSHDGQDKPSLWTVLMPDEAYLELLQTLKYLEMNVRAFVREKGNRPVQAYTECGECPLLGLGSSGGCGLGDLDERTLDFLPDAAISLAKCPRNASWACPDPA